MGKKKDDAMRNIADTDREILVPMILFCVTNKGLVTDRQLQEDLNKFMHIGIIDLQNLMREMAVEHKLFLTSYKLPLKQGQFGTFLLLGVPKTEQG